MKDLAMETANRACYKRVTDMWYEARIGAIIVYWAGKGRKVKKVEARTMKLTRQQYISVNAQN